jgi:hypothetical protein
VPTLTVSTLRIGKHCICTCRHPRTSVW